MNIDSLARYVYFVEAIESERYLRVAIFCLTAVSIAQD